MFKMIKDLFAFRKLAKTINGNLESHPPTYDNINSIVEFIDTEINHITSDFGRRKMFKDIVFLKIWKLINPEGKSGMDMQKEWGLSDENFKLLLKAKAEDTMQQLGAR